MTKTITREAYRGDNPFAAKGIKLTLVTTCYGRSNTDVRLEAHRDGILVAHATHPALLWDQIRSYLAR